MATSAVSVYKGPVFPGLRPFRADENILFFGREEQTDELLRRLADTRFLAVVGLSGTGKSSLVLAGLVPALQRNNPVGGTATWRIATMRPGLDPLAAMVQALNNSLGDFPSRSVLLRSGRLGLLDASRTGRQPQENLLFVVDQFEELFRFQRDWSGRAHEAQEFVALLLAAAHEYSPDYRIYVVLTMRSDYLGECARFTGLIQALNEGQYLTEPMTRTQLRDVIEGPAGLGGVTVEPELLETMLDNAVGQQDQLPVLQHLLMRMWAVRTGNQLTLNEYDHPLVGGWEHALDRHATAALADLPVNDQPIAKRIFQRLTETGEDNRENRRPAQLLELVDVANVPEERVRRIIEHFRDDKCSFLTCPDKTLTKTSVIDISHESLIRRWETLKAWAKEEADWGAWYQRVEDRVRTKGKLAGRELSNALVSREKAPWNESWAERYRTDKGGVKPEYDEVVRFLRHSERWQQLQRAMLAGLIGLAVALAFVFYFLYRNAENEKSLANRQSSVALAASAELSRSIQSDRALLLGVEAYKTAPTLEAFGALLAGLQSSARLIAYLYPGATAYSVAFSPDGKTLASAGGDSTVRLWEVVTRRALGEPLQGHTDGINGVAFSPDGKTLASGSEDKTVRLWDEATRRPLGEPLQGHTGPVNSVAFSPDGKMLASASADKTVLLWDLATRRALGEPLQAGFVYSVAFSPDGKTLAAACADETVRLWDVATRRALGEPLQGHTGYVLSVAFSPDGKMLASGSRDETVRLWDVATRRASGEPLQGHTGFVLSVAFSADGKTLASASWDKTVRLWDVTTRRALGEPLQGHSHAVLSVAFSPNGKTLASASDDQTVRLWDVGARRALGEPLQGHSYGVLSVAFSPDGKTLASANNDKTVQLWDVATRRALGEPLQGHTDAVNSVAFSADGKTLASGSGDKTVRLWDVATRRALGDPLRGHTDGINGVAFSPDGKALASASADKTVRLWDLATHSALGELQGHTDAVIGVAFSPDGETLASASDDGTVRLWDVATRRALGELQGHTGFVKSVAFSPSGKTLAAACADKTVRLWDVATRRALGEPLEGHTGFVLSVAFSPDGKMLASGSWDETVRLWDVATHRALGEPLQGHTGLVSSVAFSPDSRTLASASTDKTLLWDLDPQPWIRRTCAIVNRNLSMAEWQQYLGTNVSYRKTCPSLPPGS